VENGEVVPYHDRETIDSGGALEGKGLEIAWVQDPADIFFLQVQGSGRLIMPDGTEKHVLYAGKNGREYVSLGRVMKERGLLPADGISMQSIRAYLAAHPEKERELLNTNPSYVFFRLSDDGPYGSINQVLTPWVSLATDRATLPLGSAMLFSVPRPLPATVQQHGTDGRAYAEQPFTGIGLAQDTGGAIKEHRIDLFSGSGELAEFVAGHLAARGSVYLLLPRQTAP
jgi:membrane-bound lytic murein transglycosylase A